MHLGNGAITPECGIVALGAAAAGAAVAYGVARVAGPEPGKARTAGALGAAVFAAQMVNVPVLPFSSVHLVGGVLLAWALGPALGLLIMSAVLTLQAVALGDGGLLALGANILNMALVPAVGVLALRRWVPQISGARAALALGATAYLCTLAAAALITLEVAVGRGGEQLAGWHEFAVTMLGTHAVLGLFEAVVTMAAVAALSLEPQALRLQPGSVRFSPRKAGVLTAASLVVAGLSLPVFGLVTALPDGYQAVVHQLHASGRALGNLESDSLVGVGATLQAWQEAASSALPESLLVLSATAMAAGVCWALGRCCRPRAA